MSHTRARTHTRAHTHTHKQNYVIIIMNNPGICCNAKENNDTWLDSTF